MYTPHAMLQPVVTLVAWTLIMLGWTLLTRLPAMSRAGVRLSSLVGTKAADADRSLPPEVQWKAHNYNHLLEQPVLFYTICGVIVLGGMRGEDGINVMLAWSYVALRVAHSIWQATVNRVAVRFYLFLLSSLALAALTLHAAIMVF